MGQPHDARWWQNPRSTPPLEAPLSTSASFLCPLEMLLLSYSVHSTGTTRSRTDGHVYHHRKGEGDLDFTTASSSADEVIEC